MRAEAGKGCKPRPRNVSQEEYDKRWEETFGKKKDLDNDEKVEYKSDKS